eukprot:TRINITY_DN101836_c0_g1_i1.p1 TRINITY_DN101836_c0_g1~~TRINITY_DN101836_c0_g1_i1.p1  ORF type:complete len:489 (+),score=93.86 TRINITY_DN101836_c0_g1_i1:162-1628(+)
MSHAQSASRFLRVQKRLEATIQNLEIRRDSEEVQTVPSKTESNEPNENPSWYDRASANGRLDVLAGVGTGPPKGYPNGREAGGDAGTLHFQEADSTCSQSSSSGSLQRKKMQIGMKLDTGVGVLKKFDDSGSRKVNEMSSSCSVSSASSSLLSRRQVRSCLSVDTVIGRHQQALEAMQADESFQQLYEKYEIFEVIGQGAVAVVRRGQRKSDGVQVAVKLVRTTEQDVRDLCSTEFSLIESIDHPHIIKAYDMFVGASSVASVLEYFGSTSMDVAVKAACKQSSLKFGLGFSEDVAKKLQKQLFSAIAELHRLSLVHRDIKPENTLVSEDLTYLKVVDFNTAHRYQQGDALTPTGTLDYLSPEAILDASIGQKSDVWAAALCMHLMLSGKLPVRRESFDTVADFRSAVANKQVKLANRLRMATSQACQEFLLWCLALKEADRPTALEAFESEYLNSPSQDPTSPVVSPTSSAPSPPAQSRTSSTRLSL